MRHFSATTAWDATRAAILRDAGILFPVAFALLALPSILYQHFAVPAEFLAKVQAGTVTAADIGPWIYWLIPVTIVAMVGTIAISTLVLRNGTSVAEALSHALRRLPVLLLAALALAVAAALVSGLLAMLVAVVGSPGLAVLVGLCLIPLIAYMGIRLSLMTPVVSAESVGAIALIRRSWTLTGGSFWRIFGLLLLVAVVAFVALLAISAVLGIIIRIFSGRDPGALAHLVGLLVGGLLNAAISLVFSVLLAQVYAQLSGASPDGGRRID